MYAAPLGPGQEKPQNPTHLNVKMVHMVEEIVYLAHHINLLLDVHGDGGCGEGHGDGGCGEGHGDGGCGKGMGMGNYRI